AGAAQALGSAAGEGPAAGGPVESGAAGEAGGPGGRSSQLAAAPSPPPGGPPPGPRAGPAAWDRERNLGLHLRRALEELGPTFVKLGQVLSTRPDLVPPD